MPALAASFTMPRAEAAAVASMPPNASERTGAAHSVIATGNEASMSARAASAGLKMLYPTPPKSCLTRKIAAKAPRATIHSGVCGGQVKASSRPVTAALPSETLTSRLNTSWLSTSVPTATATATAASSSARHPNRYVAAARAGTSAAKTVHMTRAVSSWSRRWGETETTVVALMLSPLPGRGSPPPASSSRGSVSRI